MSVAKYLVGDVRDQLATIPDRAVDLVVTSPPFLALRSYLPADHPDKAKEIGSEPTPAAFLATMLALTEEWRRVLAPHGSICVELGDTYAGGGQGPDANHPGSLRPVAASHGRGWPLDKSLVGIPHLYNLSLAYGRNMLDPDQRFTPWRIRNYLTWTRPNPPVGALGDKFRPATSFVTVATMARDRWFDLDAVRAGVYAHPERIGKSINNGRGDTYDEGVKSAWNNKRDFVIEDRGGAPPLDWDAPDDWDDLFQQALDAFLAGWWQPLNDLPTAPYKGAHYATFPPELPRRLIEAMCPRQVCTTCGEPRRRVTSVEYEGTTQRSDNSKAVAAVLNGTSQGHHAHRKTNPTRTITAEAWSTCGHDSWRNGVVLDPFAGSGTTLAVATGCGRDAIGIDLDDRNVDLARERVGLFLEVA